MYIITQRLAEYIFEYFDFNISWTRCLEFMFWSSIFFSFQVSSVGNIVLLIKMTSGLKMGRCSFGLTDVKIARDACVNRILGAEGGINEAEIACHGQTLRFIRARSALREFWFFSIRYIALLIAWCAHHGCLANVLQIYYFCVCCWNCTRICVCAQTDSNFTPNFLILFFLQINKRICRVRMYVCVLRVSMSINE